MNKQRKYKDLWNGTLVQAFELLIDGILIFITLLFGIQMDNLLVESRWLGWNEIFGIYQSQIWQMVLYTAIALVLFRVYRTSVVKKRFSSIMMSIVLSLILTNVILVIFLALGRTNENYFLENFSSPLLLCMFQLIIFFVYKYVLNRIFIKFNKRSVLIYGPKEEVINLAQAFYLDKSNLSIVKYLVFEETINEGNILTCGLKELIDDINDVFITAEVNDDTKNILATYILQKTYKELYFVPTTYEIDISRAKNDNIDDTLVFRTKSMHLSFEQRFLKRCFDVLISSIALAILLIPMCIIALIIKTQDKGPVFFKQDRIKRSNKVFQIIKFRTMKIDADKNKQAVVGDSRITKFGRVLRATRLDELPQLINVLKGEMSLVGPRPLMLKEINETVEEHPEFAYRSNVKPGLTGYAQVLTRYNTKQHERLRYDLVYVRNYSFWLDIKILFQTVVVVFSKEAGLGRNGRDFESLLKENNDEVRVMDLGYEIISLTNEND